MRGGPADDTIPADLLRTLGLGRQARRTGPPIVDWGVATERGSQHDQNEDVWGHRDERVFVLADGMGGRPGGATAATAAVAALLDALAPSDQPLSWERAIAAANEAVIVAGGRDGHERVGATVAVVRCTPAHTHVAHAGDTRVYRLRDGRAEPLTSDHTVGNELERAGVDPGRIAGAERRLGALTTFLGGIDTWKRFVVRSLDLRSGDQLLLCTDGVHRYVGAGDWARVAAARSAQAVAHRLVAAAIHAGGRDDATALALRLGGAS
jgi:PPM family protein phosphatase